MYTHIYRYEMHSKLRLFKQKYRSASRASISAMPPTAAQALHLINAKNAYDYSMRARAKAEADVERLTDKLKISKDNVKETKRLQKRATSDLKRCIKAARLSLEAGEDLLGYDSD
jgi:hypothetical protein